MRSVLFDQGRQCTLWFAKRIRKQLCVCFCLPLFCKEIQTLSPKYTLKFFLQRHSEKVMNFRFTCNFKIHLCKFVSPSSSPLQAPSNILKSAEMRSFAISKSNFMTFSYRRRAQTQQTLHVVEAPIPPHTLFSFSQNLVSFGFKKYSGYFSCPFEGLQVLTLIC